MEIEKAIKILEPYKKSVFGDECEKYGGSISVEEIIELLKEQEAIKPKVDAFGHPYCPKCKILVYETWEFCPHCGQAVKWK